MDMVKDWTSSLTSLPGMLSRTTSLVLLRPNLWFDPSNRILWRKRKRILLTPHEIRTLTLLLQASGHYISATLLADRLSPPNGKPVYEHSVEQTISGLRRKLGESGKRQHIIQTQRSSGYRIFLPKPETIEQTKTLQARQHRIPSTPKT